MRILILGGDGYLGWPTAMRFSNRGHEVHVVDNYLRRRRTRRGRHRLAHADRCRPAGARRAWKEVTGKDIGVTEGDLSDWAVVERVFREFQPEAIVHYGELPSAPYSMKDRDHAVFTQTNNVVNTLNVLWAMRDVRARRAPGEARHDGRVRHARTSTSRRAPRDRRTTAAPTRSRSRSCPASMYHLSKVHDSHNIHFACRVWGLRATDLNQGVVYGIETDETRARRPAGHAVRLRRRVRHGAEPLLRAGGDRPPAHGLRQGRPDPRLPEHRRHARVRRAGGAEPGRPRRVPRVQPVHRAVLGHGARRARPAGGRASAASRSTSSSSTTRGWRRRSTTTTPRTRSCSTSACKPHLLSRELVESMLVVIDRYRDRVIVEHHAERPRRPVAPGHMSTR